MTLSNEELDARYEADKVIFEAFAAEATEKARVLGHELQTEGVEAWRGLLTSATNACKQCGATVRVCTFDVVKVTGPAVTDPCMGRG